MKNTLLAIASAAFFTTSAFASDAVSLFVTELLRVRSDEVWFVPSRLKDEVPKGGYLLKLDLDVNGDGENEVLVATSLDVDRKGEVWSVFKKGNPNDIQLTNELFLGGDLRMKVEGRTRKFSFYVPQKQTEGSSYFGYFWLDAGGAWHDETHTLSDTEQATMDGEDADTMGLDGKPDQQKIAQKLNLGTPVAVSIKKVLLAKYVQNPVVPWRDVKTDFTLSQQYKDPLDAADIASTSNWQPPAIP